MAAAEAGDEYAVLLGPAATKPILLFDRVSFSGGRPVEHSRSRYRGDRYELAMALDGGTPWDPELSGVTGRHAGEGRAPPATTGWENTMIRHSVESSSVSSLGYDTTDRSLEVEFRGGGVYRYLDVPFGVVERLVKAPSIGRYLAYHIRNAYRFRRIG